MRRKAAKTGLPLLLAATILAAAPASAGYYESRDTYGDAPYFKRSARVMKPWGIRSVTISGAPIATRHFQSGDNNFRERHTLVSLRVDTERYGNWGVYVLSPNSVDKTSVGVAYVTDPYIIPLGPTALELSGALGLVTGYQDYPVPLIAGNARLGLFQYGNWNAGLEMSVMPYIAEDPVTNDNEFGIVGTTPYLSLRYAFN